MKKNILKMVVGGKRIKKDLKKIMSITDIDLDMRNIAYEMSYWGRLCGMAKAIVGMADARYRNWRAKYAEQIREGSKKPPSEGKIKSKIESDPNFLKMKQQIAIAVENHASLEFIFKSLEAKSFMLPNLGAKERDYQKATGMRTPKKGK
jgi:hypothetical protein